MTRNVPSAMTAAWKSQAKIGDQKPTVRATIQRHHLQSFEYDTAWAQGGTFDHDRHRRGHFRSMIFGDDTPYREIPNIKSNEWERSIGQDAATCTLTLMNAEALGMGKDPDNIDDWEQPGYYTYNRGTSIEAQVRWSYEENGWVGVFMPDMIVKTYEGYGLNPLVSPPNDQHLIQTGVWMVDKVTYGTDGQLVLEMRDLARLLLDQVVFPPAVPIAEYPLSWTKNHTASVPGRDCKGGHWKDKLRQIGFATSSNELYVGKGLTNLPYPVYVKNSGADEGGHHASHVIGTHDRDTPEARAHDDATFWRSTGQDSQNDFVFWQFETDAGTGTVPVGALRLRMNGGPVRCYISIHNGTKWLGAKEIQYPGPNGIPGSPGNVDIGADIPFVKSVIADRYWTFDVTLPRAYNAKKIRLTFTRLNKDAEEAQHPWRCGLREVQIYTAAQKSDLHFEKGEVLKVVGNYGDYTHIVKWVCAWAGWYWPPHETGRDFIRVQSGDDSSSAPGWVTYSHPDPIMPKNGRVWGDFMKTGTAGVVLPGAENIPDLSVDMFDKKPMMDVINYVRDLIGFNFYIDEEGGAVWRMPNLWSLGNYISPDYELVGDQRVPGKRGRIGRTSEIVTLDENETLLSYQTVLDSRNIRERIFVANSVGGVGVVAKGFNPNPIGLKRVAGWTDQNFRSKRETRVMADMISARAMFTWHTSSATIPGYPKIQIDDQVRVFERVTSDTFYHYVMGIKSSLDMETGEYTYDLSLHWLGEDPSDAWAVDIETLNGATRQYLAAVGYTPDGDEDKSWEPA